MAIELYIKSRKVSIGNRAGQTLYYGTQKQAQHMTNDDVIEHIVAATSLAKGDVRNALTSLAEVVNEALRDGRSVDLAELGNLRVEVTTKMMDTPEEVTVANAVNTPKIRFTPKAAMMAAAKSVQITVDHSFGSNAVDSSSGADGSDQAGSSGNDNGGYHEIN